MNILIVTQVVDKQDDVLGFFHTWILQFARECEVVTVIALRVGDYDFPTNVRVLSLGKERGASRIKYLTRFFLYIFRERKSYDNVFVHMNQVYILLGGVLWKLMGKKIGLWYAHGSVSLSLRVATQLVDYVFTSTSSGFRIVTSKLRVVGQGIDTLRFAYIERTYTESKPFRTIVVGRISPVKDYETTIRAIALVKKAGHNIILDIVGGAGLPLQETYLTALKQLVVDLDLKDHVIFHGALPNTKVAPLLLDAHCFINTSQTGSFDKAVGEAMASGLPIVSSNEAFREVLGQLATVLMFPSGNIDALAQLLVGMIKKTDDQRGELGKQLSAIIHTQHSLENFIKRIIAVYKK